MTPIERVQEFLRKIVTDTSQPYPPLLRSEASNALYDLREHLATQTEKGDLGQALEDHEKRQSEWLQGTQNREGELRDV